MGLLSGKILDPSGLAGTGTGVPNSYPQTCIPGCDVDPNNPPTSNTKHARMTHAHNPGPRGHYSTASTHTGTQPTRPRLHMRRAAPLSLPLGSSLVCAAACTRTWGRKSALLLLRRSVPPFVLVSLLLQPLSSCAAVGQRQGPRRRSSPHSCNPFPLALLWANIEVPTAARPPVPSCAAAGRG